VIASAASADKNSLSTQTFGYTNLENHASYSGDTLGFSASGGYGWSAKDGATMSTPISQIANKLPGPQNSQGMGPSGFSAAGTSSDVTGTTYAAVSAGSITVRGDAGSGRDSTAGLSRDTASANGAVQNSFDAQKVQNDMAIQQGTVQVGMQVVGDVATALENSAIDKAKAAQKAYDDAKAAKDEAGMAQAEADYSAAQRQVALWSEDGALRMGSHAIVSGIGAAMGGGSVAGAVAGTVAGDMAGSAAGHALGDDSVGGKLLSNIASGLAGAVVGGAVGGTGGLMSGANGALGADLYNREMHPQERKLIANKAHQIAMSQAQNGGDATKIEEYWTNMMTLVANADIDAQARQQLAQQLTQMGQAAQVSGNVQAFQQFVADLNTAQQYIKGMAGQTIVSGGAPIVADDGLLKTFQATGSQFNDSTLFGTPGGTRLGLAIGETPASVGIGSQYYIAPNGPTDQQVKAFADDVLQQIGTPNGAATPVYPLENAALGWAGGKIVSGVLGKLFGGTMDGAETAAPVGDLRGGMDGAGGDLVPPKTIPYQPKGTVVLQGDAPVCGPACAAMVITDNTGKSVSLTDAIGGFANGIRSSGVNTAELSDVISNAGVQNSMQTAMLPGELAGALSRGQTVIVNVNGHFIIVDSQATVNGVSYYMTRDPYVGPRGVLASALNAVMEHGANAIVIGK
jgi:filamentous hemagglutinin